MRPRDLKAAQGRPLDFSRQLAAPAGQGNGAASAALGAEDRRAARRWRSRRQVCRAATRCVYRRRDAAADGPLDLQGLPRRCLDRSGADRDGPAADDRDAVDARRSRATPSSGKESFDPTGRQVSVLEGTSIDLAIECKNKKPLQVGLDDGQDRRRVAAASS